jgi:hypothetical protein
VPSARLLRVTLFVRQQLSLSYISREAMREHEEGRGA